MKVSFISKNRILVVAEPADIEKLRETMRYTPDDGPFLPSRGNLGEEFEVLDGTCQLGASLGRSPALDAFQLSPAAENLHLEMRAAADNWLVERSDGAANSAVPALIRHLPSGCGFNKAWIPVYGTSGKTLVLGTGYQVMNGNGVYIGWVYLRVHVCLDRSWRVTFRWEEGRTSALLRNHDHRRDEIVESIADSLREWEKGAPLPYWVPPHGQH
jgi:hypothetical protein